MPQVSAIVTFPCPDGCRLQAQKPPDADQPDGRWSRQIGPLLQSLADPTHQLSADERDACRVLEGRLRDALRAGNLVSQGVSDAIQAARGRGVEVVLVDNRGSKLPEAVRRTTLRQLEQLVRSSTSGRIVARTAPEGYAEAVTILQVDAERNLTTIDESGTVTVRKT